MNTTYIILDGHGNKAFKGRTFTSFEAAAETLYNAGEVLDLDIDAYTIHMNDEV